MNAIIGLIGAACLLVGVIWYDAHYGPRCPGAYTKKIADVIVIAGCQ